MRLKEGVGAIGLEARAVDVELTALEEGAATARGGGGARKGSSPVVLSGLAEGDAEAKGEGALSWSRNDVREMVFR